MSRAFGLSLSHPGTFPHWHRFVSSPRNHPNPWSLFPTALLFPVAPRHRKWFLQASRTLQLSLSHPVPDNNCYIGCFVKCCVPQAGFRLFLQSGPPTVALRRFYDYPWYFYFISHSFIPHSFICSPFVYFILTLVSKYPGRGWPCFFYFP